METRNLTIVPDACDVFQPAVGPDADWQASQTLRHLAQGHRPASGLPGRRPLLAGSPAWGLALSLFR